jgi:uncharacterized membrane protein
VHVFIFLYFFVAVVSAVISVICELARKNPKNYLSLAPQLFKLLTTSSNNWMLIKIIKLVKMIGFEIVDNTYIFFLYSLLR